MYQEPMPHNKWKKEFNPGKPPTGAPCERFPTKWKEIIGRS